MFRSKKRLYVVLSPAEKKLIRLCLLELRNKLLAAELETDDIDALLLRLMS